MEFLVEDTILYLCQYIDSRKLLINRKFYETILPLIRHTYEYDADSIIRDIDIFSGPYPRIIRNFTSVNTDILKQCEIIEIGDMNNMLDGFLDLKNTKIKHIIRSDKDCPEELDDTYYSIIYPLDIITISSLPGDDFFEELYSLQKISVKQRFSPKYIINLPKKLTHLYTHESFYCLQDWVMPLLPTSITHLSLNIALLVKVEFPKTLTHLWIFGESDTELNDMYLHEGLKFLYLEHCYGDITTKSIPVTLEEFIIKSDYNGKIFRESFKKIKVLKFEGKCHNYCSSIMPENLETLVLGKSGNELIAVPDKLKYLKLGFQKWTLVNWPSTLKEFICKGNIGFQFELEKKNFCFNLGKNLKKINFGTIEKLDISIHIPDTVTELFSSARNLSYLKINHKIEKLILTDNNYEPDCYSAVKNIECNIIEIEVVYLIDLHNNFNECTHTLILSNSFREQDARYRFNSHFFQIPYHIQTIEFTDSMCDANYYKKIPFHVKKIIYNSKRKYKVGYFYHSDRDVVIVQKSNKINYEPKL